MSIESQADLDGLRAAGRVVAKAIRAMRGRVRPGISTHELDRIGARVFADAGARSAPQLATAFPASTASASMTRPSTASPAAVAYAKAIWSSST